MTKGEELAIIIDALTNAIRVKRPKKEVRDEIAKCRRILAEEMNRLGVI